MPAKDLPQARGLRDLQEDQREFVSLISHDLRSPLTGLMGMAQLLARTLANKSLEQEVRVVESAIKNAGRMEAMIRDLVESLEEVMPRMLRPRSGTSWDPVMTVT